MRTASGLEEKPSLDDALEHYGIKGMKWGVRRSREQLARARGDKVPRKTERAAKKDAKEFARAKMFYGEGAGTRRKLIRESVKAKSKRDPAYEKAFNRNLEKQDLSKHADKAKSERKSTDRKLKTKQRAGFLARRATGEMGTQAAFAAITMAGVAFARSPKGQAALRTNMAAARETVNKMATARQRQQMAQDLQDLFNRSS